MFSPPKSMENDEPNSKARNGRTQGSKNFSEQELTTLLAFVSQLKSLGGRMGKIGCEPMLSRERTWSGLASPNWDLLS
jgi:hypothetical protein